MNGTSHTVYIQQENTTSHYLKLEKPSETNISFTEGLSLQFTESSPEHLTFYFSSMNKEQEDTNLRLKDGKGRTVLLFRCGNAGFLRLNENQMVGVYNFSLAKSDQNIIWTKVQTKQQIKFKFQRLM